MGRKRVKRVRVNRTSRTSGIGKIGKIKGEEPKKTEGEKGRKDYLFIIAIVSLVLILLVSIYYSLSRLPVEYEEIGPRFISVGNATLVSMDVPAVDAEGKGVATTLFVEAMPGSGRVLLDINDLLFWADTEHSIRVARLVAANVTDLDVEKYDLVYYIEANASLIGGESAGAALAIATIAALQNKSLDPAVMITGTINHDGSIGPISGVLEKAKAAKAINATIFLVPLLQSIDVTYETRKHCEKFGVAEICTVEQIPTKVKVGEQAGIEVREVETVQEALKYFIH